MRQSARSRRQERSRHELRVHSHKPPCRHGSICAICLSTCAPGPQVPDEILHDKALNDAVGVLPANYSFEVGARLSSHVCTGHQTLATLWQSSDNFLRFGVPHPACRHRPNSGRIAHRLQVLHVAGAQDGVAGEAAGREAGCAAIP